MFVARYQHKPLCYVPTYYAGRFPLPSFTIQKAEVKEATELIADK